MVATGWLDMGKQQIDQESTVHDLESKLGLLAAEWRSNYSNPDLQTALVREYHSTIEQLYNIGWDDEIDIENCLPDNLMPTHYRERNPRYYGKASW